MKKILFIFLLSSSSLIFGQIAANIIDSIAGAMKEKICGVSNTPTVTSNAGLSLNSSFTVDLDFEMEGAKIQRTIDFSSNKIWTHEDKKMKIVMKVTDETSMCGFDMEIYRKDFLGRLHLVAKPQIQCVWGQKGTLDITSEENGKIWVVPIKRVKKIVTLTLLAKR